MIYSGIGSRSTPQDILDDMHGYGYDLAVNGHTLRSGGSWGADENFEKGCDESVEQGFENKKEIYLPVARWRENPSPLFNICDEATAITKQFKKNFDTLGEFHQRLLTRNVYQVLGKSLDEPSDFVICWTNNGKDVGGTGFTTRLAKSYKIPVFNLYNSKDVNKLNQFLFVHNQKES